MRPYYVQVKTALASSASSSGLLFENVLQSSTFDRAFGAAF